MRSSESMKHRSRGKLEWGGTVCYMKQSLIALEPEKPEGEEQLWWNKTSDVFNSGGDPNMHLISAIPKVRVPSRSRLNVISDTLFCNTPWFMQYSKCRINLTILYFSKQSKHQYMGFRGPSYPQTFQICEYFRPSVSALRTTYYNSISTKHTLICITVLVLQLKLTTTVLFIYIFGVQPIGFKKLNSAPWLAALRTTVDSVSNSIS